jgi:hypothetical protein
MAKLASIALSFLILTQSFNMDLGDLAHIDDLLEHAEFHSEKYGDNLLVFISKHYGELQNEHNQNHQDEKKEHEELPFTHQSCSHAFTAFVLNRFEIQILKTDPVADSTTNFHYLENYSSLEKTDIFQPPRQA